VTVCSSHTTSDVNVSPAPVIEVQSPTDGMKTASLLRKSDTYTLCYLTLAYSLTTTPANRAVHERSNGLWPLSGGGKICCTNFLSQESLLTGKPTLKREFIRHGLERENGKNKKDRREKRVACWDIREGEMNERELGKMRMGINGRGWDKKGTEGVV